MSYQDNTGVNVISQRKTQLTLFAPVALFLALFLGIALLASEKNRIAAQTPDVVKTYHSCEYLGKDAVMLQYQVWEYISTSCGHFNQPYKDFGFEKGKTYDIDVTKSATNGTYMSKVTVSSK